MSGADADETVELPPIGEAHREVLDERLAEHERDPGNVISREEVLAEARRR